MFQEKSIDNKDKSIHNSIKTKTPQKPQKQRNKQRKKHPTPKTQCLLVLFYLFFFSPPLGSNFPFSLHSINILPYSIIQQFLAKSLYKVPLNCLVPVEKEPTSICKENTVKINRKTTTLFLNCLHSHQWASLKSVENVNISDHKKYGLLFHHSKILPTIFLAL